MKPSWYDLDVFDRKNFGTLTAFLDGRLESQHAIDWALALKPNDSIERLAIKHVLDNQNEKKLKEPWLNAWKIIEESWSFSLDQRNSSTAIYHISRRLKYGDYSGALISDLVDIVRPHLTVQPVSKWRPSKKGARRKPNDFKQIIYPKLSSGKLIDIEALKLEEISNISFLTELATALEAAIGHGLNIGRRIGWKEERSFFYLGRLNRVYYTQPKSRIDEENEPDAYNRGIAPATKFLHAVMSRLSELAGERVSSIIEMWRINSSPVHIRLWAALARDKELVSAKIVGNTFDDMGIKRFWDVNDFSEISELRALRFGELSSNVQTKIVKRILAKPPRNFWPRNADKGRVEDARLYWVVRELKRIEIVSNKLPTTGKTFLDANIDKFPKLLEMVPSADFPVGTQGGFIPPNPDNKFDTLEGDTRLKLLEIAFATDRKRWDDNPAGRAADWLSQDQNALLVLEDFKTQGLELNAFPNVWEKFGWTHTPNTDSKSSSDIRDLAAEGDSVITLLITLSPETGMAAIEGICAWLDRWGKTVARSALGLQVWQKYWPLAVTATNLKTDENDDTNLSVVAWSNDTNQEPMDLDTLNSPAGKLVGVFLEACPNLTEHKYAFSSGTPERIMRDEIISSPGRSNLIAQHRMIESLNYFLHLDLEWTEKNLIAPLMKDDPEALVLWRAIARRTHFKKTLEIIGVNMAERATDMRLGRESRGRLVFSLVIEILHSFRKKRKPAVSISVIQQMLRTLDDEVRASAASALQSFVRDLSNNTRDGEDKTTAESLFYDAVAPFLEQVWPQERSLATPGVSDAFAGLPATCKDAFAEAVNSIERFLVPFETWSMGDYGLYGEDDDLPKLAMIDTPTKAQALINLMDLTIGQSEGAIIPYDLTKALDQISSVAPQLANAPAYRRLETSTRR